MSTQLSLVGCRQAPNGSLCGSDPPQNGFDVELFPKVIFCHCIEPLICRLVAIPKAVKNDPAHNRESSSTCGDGLEVVDLRVFSHLVDLVEENLAASLRFR